MDDTLTLLGTPPENQMYLIKWAELAFTPWCFSAYLSCDLCLFELLLSFLSTQPVWSLVSTGIFTHRAAAHWIFFLFQPLLCKPSRRLCGKIPADQQFLKYANNNATSRVTSVIFFLLQQIVLTMSACLKALSFCRVIVLSDISVNMHLNKRTYWSGRWVYVFSISAFTLTLEVFFFTISRHR